MLRDTTRVGEDLILGRQIFSNSDDRYSIPRRGSQKVQNLLNEELTPLLTKPPRLDKKINYCCENFLRLSNCVPNYASSIDQAWANPGKCSKTTYNCGYPQVCKSKILIYANLAILATPVCVIGHQEYVLDPRWLSSLLDKLDVWIPDVCARYVSVWSGLPMWGEWLKRECSSQAVSWND